MPEQKRIMTDEELRELREKTEENLQRTSEMLKEIVAFQKESNKKSAESRREIEELQKKNEKTIGELSNASKNHGKLIGNLGNKFGKFTESLAEPSLKRILDVRFDADYQGWLYHNELRGVQDLEVDGWAKARNGTGAAFLVEIKSKFKPKHITQVWRLVEKFREYNPDYRHRAVYPILAVVEIKNSHRELIWQSGIYLIDIADGVFEMTEPPAEFKPSGYHGSDAVRRDVPHLRLIRSDNQERQTTQ